MASSTFRTPIETVNTPISPNSDILSNPITFEENELSPAGAGTMRIWLTFAFVADVDSIISISTKPAFADPEQLNADNNFIIKSKGKYRFDIDIEQADQLQIRSSIQIDTILKLRFHKIVFGA